MPKVNETEMRVLPVELTPAEVDAAARTLADVSQQELDLRKAKSDAAKEFTTKIKAAEERKRDLVNEVRTSVGQRELECVWTADAERKRWNLMRPDTGVLVESKAMTEAEVEEIRQPHLFPIEGGGRKLIGEEKA